MLGPSGREEGASCWRRIHGITEGAARRTEGTSALATRNASDVEVFRVGTLSSATRADTHEAVVSRRRNSKDLISIILGAVDVNAELDALQEHFVAVNDGIFTDSNSKSFHESESRKPLHSQRPNWSVV